MKLITSICSIILILFFIISFLYAQPKYEVIKDGQNRYCGRKLSYKTSNLGYDVAVASTAACLGRAADKTGFARASVVNIGISSAFTPYFRFMFSKANFNAGNKISLKNFFAQLFFIRVIEYEEKNGVKGFQPGNDTIVKSYPLFNTGLEKLWTRIQHNVSQIAEGVEVHELFMELRKSSANVGNVKFGIKITPKEVKYSNGTKKAMILTPNSVKLDVEFTDISYSDGKTTGLALEAGLLIKGATTRKNITKVATADESTDRPDDANNDQEVVEMNNEDESERAGFCSWKKWAYKNIGSTTVDVVTSSWDVRGGSDLPGSDYTKAGYSINRVYFSFPERVTDIDWDPALGAIEDPETGGVLKLTVSLILFSVSIFITLFMS